MDRNSEKSHLNDKLFEELMFYLGDKRNESESKKDRVVQREKHGDYYEDEDEGEIELENQKKKVELLTENGGVSNLVQVISGDKIKVQHISLIEEFLRSISESVLQSFLSYVDILEKLIYELNGEKNARGIILKRLQRLQIVLESTITSLLDHENEIMQNKDNEHDNNEDEEKYEVKEDQRDEDEEEYEVKEDQSDEDDEEYVDAKQTLYEDEDTNEDVDEITHDAAEIKNEKEVFDWGVIAAEIQKREVQKMSALQKPYESKKRTESNQYEDSTNENEKYRVLLKPKIPPKPKVKFMIELKPKSISNEINTSDFVYCQFCDQLVESLRGLINHLERNCKKFKNKTFQNLKKHPRFLFRAHFQLLINNQIKCNVCGDAKFDDLITKKEHEQSHGHKSKLRMKNLESDTLNNFICCYFCKTLIADTQIQFKAHLENKEHKFIVSNVKSYDEMMEKGHHFIILKNHHVKCIVCLTELQCDKEKIERHNGGSQHKMRKSIKTGKFTTSDEARIFCELCYVTFELQEWDVHMSTKNQIANTLKLQSVFHSAMKYECCIFCNEAFSDLEKLALHLEDNDLHRDLFWFSSV